MKDSPSQRFLTASFDGPLRKDPKEGGGSSSTSNSGYDGDIAEIGQPRPKNG
jgi:hypothetical protein